MGTFKSCLSTSWCRLVLTREKKAETNRAQIDDLVSMLITLLVLGPVHTGTISYRSSSVSSKKSYGEGLRSHGNGKNKAVRS